MSRPDIPRRAKRGLLTDMAGYIALVLRQSFPDLAVLSADARVRTHAAQLGFNVQVSTV